MVTDSPSFHFLQKEDLKKNPLKKSPTYSAIPIAIQMLDFLHTSKPFFA